MGGYKGGLRWAGVRVTWCKWRSMGGREEAWRGRLSVGREAAGPRRDRDR